MQGRDLLISSQLSAQRWNAFESALNWKCSIESKASQFIYIVQLNLDSQFLYIVQLNLASQFLYIVQLNSKCSDD